MDEVSEFAPGMEKTYEDDNGDHGLMVPVQWININFNGHASTCACGNTGEFAHFSGPVECPKCLRARQASTELNHNG